VARYDEIQRLIALGRKTICLCNGVDYNLRKLKVCPILTEEINWCDVSITYKDKLLSVLGGNENQGTSILLSNEMVLKIIQESVEVGYFGSSTTKLRYTRKPS